MDAIATVYIKQEAVETDETYEYEKVFVPIKTEFPSVKEEHGNNTINNTKQSFECIICQKRFIRKGKLKAHIKAHTKTSESNSFNNDSLLISYIPASTTEKKPHECSICHKAYSLRANLDKHKRVHTHGELMCQICNDLFSNEAAFLAHTCSPMTPTQTSSKRTYQCDVCHKRFAYQSNFIRHKYTHTGERPYVCNICSKGFYQPSALRVHVRIHTGAKPFECEVCFKSFIQKCDLSRHMRIHTGEKPFTCDICHIGFTQKSNLASHMRTHTGDTSHECNICHIQFAQSSNLASHKRLHLDIKTLQRHKQAVIKKGLIQPRDNSIDEKLEGKLTEHIRAQWKDVMDNM